MELKLNLKVTTTYDYVIFNGDNNQEVIDFVKKHHINGEEDFWELRPTDIPNLDYGDFVKWWESTGEIKEDTSRFGNHTYNTHNTNNLPMWRKDELLRLITKGSQSGYVSNNYMKKNDGIIVWGRDYMFCRVIDDNTIEDFVKELVLDSIPYQCEEKIKKSFKKK